MTINKVCHPAWPLNLEAVPQRLGDVSKETNQQCFFITALRHRARKNEKIDIQVYPNPASDFLTVHIDHQLENSVSFIEVYNTIGQKVLTENQMSPVLNISLEELKNGMYIMVFKNSAGENLAEQTFEVIH